MELLMENNKMKLNIQLKIIKYYLNMIMELVILINKYNISILFNILILLLYYQILKNY